MTAYASLTASYSPASWTWWPGAADLTRLLLSPIYRCAAGVQPWIAVPGRSSWPEPNVGVVGDGEHGRVDRGLRAHRRRGVVERQRLRRGGPAGGDGPPRGHGRRGPFSPGREGAAPGRRAGLRLGELVASRPGRGPGAGHRGGWGWSGQRWGAVGSVGGHRCPCAVRMGGFPRLGRRAG